MQHRGIREFAKAHGDRTGNDWVYHKGRYIFPDGAMCDAECFQRWSPPIDPTENRAQRRYYLMCKLEDEIKQFDTFKARCLEQAQFAKQGPNFCAPPSAGAIQQLERGKERIAKLREAIAELDAEQRKDPDSDVSIRQARMDRLQEQHNEIDRIVSAIAAVDI